MSNYMNNPDYPVNVGSFAQHTWQGQQQTGNQFYYGGSGFGTQMVPDTGARRLDGTAPQQPQYGAYPQQQYGYGQPQQQPVPQAQLPTGVGQMLATPENGVQPFSSYPPNNGQPAFNQFMTDARRADAGAAQALGNNPWAQNQQPAAPPPMPTPGYTQPALQYGAYPPNNQGYQDATAMYQYGQQMGQNPFEKKPGVNVWDNMYTAPQPYVSPNQTMWTNAPAQAQQAPPVYSFPNQGVPNMAPPLPQIPNENWTITSHNSWDHH